MKKVFLLVTSVLFSGCASQELKPGMISMYTTPITNNEKDPEIDFEKYQKFTTYPIAEIEKDHRINPIEEKQLLYLVRNELELSGYYYTNTIEQSDFYVGIIFSNEYKSEYIPPSTSTIPWYVPGQTQTTYMNLYGNTGSYYGTATTTTPGYYMPMTITRPGQYVGAYYPCFKVVVFDNNLEKLVWSGSTIAATNEPDTRRSASTLLPGLLEIFPKAKDWGKKYDSKNGVLGCGFHIFTMDGNNFYPVVTGLWSKSPASNEGLKIYDIITYINGESTLNKPLSEIRALFDKDQGDSLTLTVQRNNKSFELSLIAEAESDARQKWKKVRCAGPKGEINMTVNQVQDYLNNITITRNELFDLIP